MNDRLLINKYPKIAEEWNYEKNIGIDINKMTYGSERVVWWICEKKHEWKEKILKRTSGKRGCTQCKIYQKKYNISIAKNFPDLLTDWDYEKNKDKDPCQISYKARLMVWWKCKNNHESNMMISTRINGIGCLECNDITEIKITEKYAELLKEFNTDKNNISIDDITYRSNNKIWWICKKNHEWEATFYDRSIRAHGCPICNSRKLADDNNLEILYPAISQQWNYEKNGDLKPNQCFPASNKIVWWKCDKGHEWQTAISARTLKKSSCLYCVNIAVTNDDSFGNKHSNLLVEWNYDKNINIDPYKLSEYSHKKVWWKCDKNHEWYCNIYNRTLGSNCPACSKGSFSKLGIEILNVISKINNINIQHAMNGGEFKINLDGKMIKVDGYCIDTNTIWEINGCFYHAHISPTCNLRRNWKYFDIHPYGNGKTYLEKYIDTLDREQKLRNLGYNVISLWECECKRILNKK
ncbi:restriction endonuclease type II-like protein [Fadolivirus algeromassiliense]|jgi:G:T-mismatch repair DNA endonuclease (very short patch repair protein)|uniref:Restriction endonuclease type II-like protein n=1 Tax=Fadolivirus FV1/VV64 TaxID=3070911 RepID=A0A7D3R0Q7_9VIRU|nr:restriction endonuclease type II-like protein [Fadolivirus algeromassiliense]QKF93881.1 restriction endonuclease type II-like protein [Fadolivirus FV1/VV64]